MSTSSFGRSRDTIDKYYTSGGAVALCLSHVRSHVEIGYNDLIIEPSAGNGAFIPGIKEILSASNYKFFDIAPEHPDIETLDYTNYVHTHPTSSLVHVIGNPPFGRQSSMAIKFIRKSCEFADTVSFILPKSFKKDSMKAKVPLTYHLLFEADLPKNSFIVGGAPHDVPCVFQIWERRDYSRQTVAKIAPSGFAFVKKTCDTEPDISFQRVGGHAGKIDTNIQDKCEQAHYFIKFTNGKTVAENVTALQVARFQHDNTVGPRSISKPELTKEFNAIL